MPAQSQNRLNILVYSQRHVASHFPTLRIGGFIEKRLLQRSSCARRDGKPNGEDGEESGNPPAWSEDKSCQPSPHRVSSVAECRLQTQTRPVQSFSVPSHRIYPAITMLG